MNIGVVGLGRMGSAIAERLLAAGHDVVVHNRSQPPVDELVAAGAAAAPSRTAIWDRADVCVTMMADPAALLAVAVDEDGLATAPNAHGKLLIDMSTVGPDSSGRVAAAAESNGLSYLRAPVSGNPGVVRAGNLTIVVSGARDAFDSAADLLRDIGPTLFYVGEGERSRVVKLALNLMIGGTSQLLAEAVTLGESYGVDRSDLLEVVAASAIGSPFVRYKKDALANDDYSTTFTTTGLRKDMDLALDCASESGVPLPVTAMVQQLLQACISSGMGNLDFTALLPRLQREAGAIDELPGIGAAAAPH